MFRQSDRLDDEIDELWELMQRNFKRTYGRRRKTVSFGDQLAVHICMSKAYDGLQIKIWGPRGLKTKGT